MLTDTLLKIAVTFSSAVVKPLHELLLANSKEPEISRGIQSLHTHKSLEIRGGNAASGTLQ
jgi:hypothetical protein